MNKLIKKHTGTKLPFAYKVGKVSNAGECQNVNNKFANLISSQPRRFET